MTALDARSGARSEAAADPSADGAVHSLGPVDQIPFGEGRTFVVEQAQIAVFRLKDGTLRALDAVCPHRGGPLADGQLDARVVICPLHQHAFELSSGQCLTGAPAVRNYTVWVNADAAIEITVKDSDD